MSSDDRVSNVVSSWAHLPAPPVNTDLLSVLWARSHNNVPFQPDAVLNLIEDLQDEFAKQPIISVDLEATDFDPGSIKTVGDLKNAIRQMA